VAREVEIYADCSCSKKEINDLLQHRKDHVNIISYNTPAQLWSTEAGRPLSRYPAGRLGYTMGESGAQQWVGGGDNSFGYREASKPGKG
jgi:hypothetical protein